MDQNEFRKLALAEMDAVHRLAYHLAHDPQEAGDYVQETYLRALKSSADFELSEHGLRPWLFKILHNVVHTHSARRARQPTLVSDFEGHEARSDPTPDGPWSQVAELNWEHIDERLVRAIRDMPVTYRTVFLLSAVEGLRYRQIADVTDLPVTTVTTRLYVARQLLSSRLGDLAAENGFAGKKDPSPPEGEGLVQGYPSHGGAD